MSAEQVDSYLRDLEEPKRTTLQELRRTILEIVPDAEEVISYRVPAFRLHGKVIAGFAAFKNHLSYLPFSGSVLGQLADELDGYVAEKRWSNPGWSRQMRSTPSSNETPYVRRTPRESKYSMTSPSPASGAPMTQIASGNSSWSFTER